MSAVAQAKFSPPPVILATRRPRLFDRMTAYADARLTLIVGQAAQGKSILAATWLHQAQVPFVWINLESGDKYLANFFQSLVQALEPHLSARDFAYLITLPAVSVNIDPEPNFAKYVTPLKSRLKTDVHIVVDDLDQLPPDAPMFGLLQELVTSGPLKARWMLLSRQVPPLAIETLNIQRQVLQIDNDQLAFTPEESRAFFQNSLGLHFAEQQFERIQRACEGWIGGMVLLNQALEGLVQKERNSYLERLPDRYIATQTGRYFDSVFLSCQPEKIQSLLIKCAIFKNIRPKVLEALFPGNDIKPLFESMATRHLFVTKMNDDHQGGVYRFHNLLRDRLLQLFRQQNSPLQRRRYYNRAAEVLKKLGDTEEAMQFFLNADEPLSAVGILEQIGFNLLLAGRQADLQEWLSALPTTLVEQRSWLLFYSAQAYRHRSVTVCFQHLEKALEGFRADKDVRGRLLALGVFIDTILLTGSAKVPLGDLVKQAETLLAEADGKTFPLETTLLRIHVGAAYAFRGGVGLDQIATCQHALQKALQQQHPLLIFKAQMSMVLVYTMHGQFESAQGHLDHMVQILEAFPYPELISSHLGMKCVLHLMQGATAALAEVVEQLDAIIADNKLFYLDTMARTSEMYHALVAENDQKAKAVGQYLIQYSTTADDQYNLGSTHLILAVNAYIHERYGEAVSLGQKAVKTMALPAGHSDDHLVCAKVVLGLAHIHLAEFEPSATYLCEAEAYFKAAENRFFMVDVQMAQALYAHGRQDWTRMTSWLQKGFRAMEKHNYHHLLMISRRDLAFCAYLALVYNVPHTRNIVTTLLTGELKKKIPPELAKLKHHKVLAVRATVSTILETLHRAKHSPLAIACLGKFQVMAGPDGTCVEWDRKTPRNLLMMIVAHDGKLPIEQAMEMLWPESAPEKQKSNFKVTLHRLRKTLEPEMDKTYGSSYLHIKDNCLVLDNNMCRLECVRFEQLCQKGDNARRTGNDRQAETFYQEALALYEGDFLPHDLYEDWAEAKRTYLRNRCIDMALALVLLFEERLAYDDALACLEKILALDPLHEEAYRRMMQLYARCGDTVRVHLIYADCCNALEKEIGAGPSPKTIAVFNTSISQTTS